MGRKKQQEIVQLLPRSDIFVAPSVTDNLGTQEGIPNALKEAMATALPVISSYHAGIPEVVEHGVSGFLVPERSVDELTKTIETLASQADQWHEIGQRARDVIVKRFALDKLGQELQRIMLQTANE